MKKRFLIPAVCVGGFFGLAALGTIIDNSDIANCNNGDLAACSEVMEHTQDQITNKEWLANQAKQKAKGQAETRLFSCRKGSLADCNMAARSNELSADQREMATNKANTLKANKAKVAAAAAKFKAEGWWEQKPGIFVRWCGGKHGYCPGKESYQDYSWRVMVWCKERACGDIYAKLNISQNGTVVGWTNETAYGGYGQKVVLTFGSYTRGNGQIVEFNARG